MPLFDKKFLSKLPARSTISADKESSSEFQGYIDTGSYTLNALLSGSLFGGAPNNKVVCMAGDPATGKSFFMLAMVKRFLDSHPQAECIYCDTESAITDDMMTERGIDTTRVIKCEPETLEQFKQTIMAFLDKYAELAETDRTPLLVVLDSLGALSSEKEMGDARDQNNARDMTKAGLVRGIFRVLRLRMSKLGVPLWMTNHVYAVIGAYVPTKVPSGGQGMIYSSDAIIMLSKSKDRDKDKSVIGSIIKATAFKSRYTREQSQIETRISFKGGLDRYYGLLEYAVASGVVTVPVQGKYLFPGQSKPLGESKIAAEPEKFYTEDVLKQIDTYVQSIFNYGGGENEVSETDAAEAED